MVQDESTADPNITVPEVHAEPGAVGGEEDYLLDEDDDLEAEKDDGVQQDELNDEEEGMEKLLWQQEKEKDPILTR